MLRFQKLILGCSTEVSRVTHVFLVYQSVLHTNFGVFNSNLIKTLFRIENLDINILILGIHQTLSYWRCSRIRKFQLFVNPCTKKNRLAISLELVRQAQNSIIRRGILTV